VIAAVVDEFSQTFSSVPQMALLVSAMNLERRKRNRHRYRYAFIAYARYSPLLFTISAWQPIMAAACQSHH
jgi:hypothetical protein